ncbi:MAG: excalibur calcium-binding domain-containing protein [Sphingomicrobium sp.]|nr:excalibur calcium-binding domain-containing protein [Sphingomonadales bacterium]
MDGKFILLVLFASTGAFAGTWMLMRPPPPPELHAAEIPAKDSHGKVLAFANCQQVQAAGLAPLYAGRPGYTRELDPDGTGIACLPR